MKTIPFNINDKVRVKLTETGRAIMLKRHEALMAPYRELAMKDPYAFQPVSEDRDGWSEWQFWHLMEVFGEHLHMGCQNPFEFNIEIEAKS